MINLYDPRAVLATQLPWRKIETSLANKFGYQPHAGQDLTSKDYMFAVPQTHRITFTPSSMHIKVFSAEYLDDLTQQATATPRRRQHRNIHTDYADPCQRLFNAIEPDSYLRPHRHGPAQGAETMIAVRGLMALVIFDDDGAIEQVQRFGAGPHTAKPDVAVGAETPPGKWHTVVSLEAGLVLLEVKAGPFDPRAPKFPATWAPAEGSPDALRYFENLVEQVKGVSSLD